MVKQMILDFLGSKGIVLKDSLEETNTFDILDSMSFLELLATLEDQQKTEIDLSRFDLEDFQTFSGLIVAIEKCLKG